jgi:hypothetical protein
MVASDFVQNIATCHTQLKHALLLSNRCMASGNAILLLSPDSVDSVTVKSYSMVNRT